MLSRCMVYTIDSEDMVVDQFECDREFAIQEYHNQRTPKGRYLIANLDDKIKFKFRRKPLKPLKYTSTPDS